MIRNRLAELLFERDIKIVRISKETGISRNTITNTASNNSEMLQMNTINKICRYLDITPCEFFDYIPIDIDVTFYEDDKIDIVDDWSLDSGDYRIKFDVDLLLDIDIEGRKQKIDSKIIVENTVITSFPFQDIMLSIQTNDTQMQELISIFNTIPKEFKKLIYKNLIERYKEFILEHIDPNDALDSLTYKYHLIDGATFVITNDFLKYY
ncbi:helix-turn-helix domain-containing protein [Staphylococcus pseudintermedius]|uniref:helix-turn-helix domain-containing protein n=1 Tax=Staphylococcus pseudintermedius TaxID=283734 RepID=UPI000C1C24CD|nr:helix-turn-helix transcriptional regulator [Staphylococcus pseudintermedius]